MRELVCIVCPKGCSMRIEEKDGSYTVSGNTCKRGAEFAISEMTRPMRTPHRQSCRPFPMSPC